MRKIPIALIVLLNYLNLTPASAFEDPSALMPQLDQFLGNIDFAEAFRQGDNFYLLRTNCENLTHKCNKMSSRYEVLSANLDKGEVATFIGDRTSPSSIAKVTRRQWQGISGNMARNIIREIESYGAPVSITGLRELITTITVNGRQIHQTAMELSFVYKPALGTPSQQKLLLSRGLRGPGQIIQRSIDDGAGGDTTTEILSGKLVP